MARHAILLALVIALFAPSAARAEGGSWATTQAAELTRQGDEHARRGEAEMAARRYLEALRFDGTYGPAYLALGAVHEAAGDPKEAERAYSVGIDHVAGFAEALAARARIRARQQRRDEALADFEAASALRPDDVGLLNELAAIYLAQGSLPAALATTRRIATVAEAQRDTRAASEARVRARALALLVGEVDPVIAGTNGRVRRAIAQYARRR